MNITILGTGMVGQILAGKLEELGHQITMGTRDPEKTKARTDTNPITGQTFGEWHAQHPRVELKPYPICADRAELLLNATSGGGALPALQAVGKDKLAGKILIDVANPLDFSQGMPPTLTICNTDSLGEQIQRTYPEAKVVKTFNTMNAMVMVNPAMVPGDHHVFLSGNDSDAKQEVNQLLQSIGWPDRDILDLGDITTARGTEMLMPIWMRLWGAYGDAAFNFHIQR